MTKKTTEKNSKKLTRDAVAIIACVVVLVSMFTALLIVPSVFGFGAVPAACGICLVICLAMFIFLCRP